VAKNIFFAGILLCFLFSCGHPELEIQNQYAKNDSLNLSFDTAIFPIPKEAVSFKLYSAVEESKFFSYGTLDCIGFGITLYGLDTLRLIKLQESKRLTPLSINEAYHYFPINDSSHIIIFEKFILFVNQDGVVYKDIPLNSPKQYIHLFNQGFHNSIYDGKNKRTFTPLFIEQNHKAAYPFYVFDGIIDLATGNIEPIKTKCPKNFEDNMYGKINRYYRCLNDSLLVYSFAISNNLYVYNINTKETKVVGCKSKSFTKFPLLKVSMDARKIDVHDHAITAPRYGHIIFDPNYKLYYRVFFHGQPLKDEHGIFNTTETMPASLIILNTNFEILDEIEIPKEVNRLISPMMTNQGLLFFGTTPADQGQIIKYFLLNK